MTDVDGIIEGAKAQVEVDEGLRLKAYPDPVSKGAPWTIGYGHTGPEVRPGLIWTQQQADAALIADLTTAAEALDRELPWWTSMGTVRAGALLNLAFNIGVAKLLKWSHFIGFLKAGSYTAAAVELRHTQPWASQVGDRAQRLADAFRTGVAPA